MGGDILDKLKRYTIVGIIFTIFAGIFLHFSFALTENNKIVGFISAVNESTWEHMKLVFFPILLYSCFMNHKLKNEYPCITASIFSGILLGTLLIPIIFYTYSGILGFNLLVLDIGTFIISVLTSFYVIYKLTISCRVNKFQILLGLLVLSLAVCFIAFTYNPPAVGIFIAPNL